MVALVAAGISFHRGRMRGAPFYPAGADVIRMALREIGLKPHEHFYDLGAGDGTALVIADREFNARPTGFEVSLFAYWIAKIKLKSSKAGADLHLKNFFKADLNEADAVFAFLAVRTMAAVEEKLKTGLKPGARAIVYAFPLPTKQPLRTIPVHGQWNLYLYQF